METTQKRISREILQSNSGDRQIVSATPVQADGAQTYQMGINDAAYIYTPGHSSNTNTVTLPPVLEAAGRTFFVCNTAVTAALTLEDYGDDAGFADKTLDAADDHILVYSTGERWLILVNGIA